MSMASKFQKLINCGNGSPTAIAHDLHAEVVRFVVAKLKLKNMSKTDLALKIGVKESRISRILNDDGNLTMLTVGKLFWAFGEMPELTVKKREPLRRTPARIKPRILTRLKRD